MSNQSNYYENIDSNNNIEIAELAEDISTTDFKNTKGEFFIKVLTPMEEASNQTLSLEIPGYMFLPFAGINILSMSYKGKLIVKIPGALHLLSCLKKSIIIPKGTKFLVCFIGGEVEYERIKIIGLC